MTDPICPNCGTMNSPDQEVCQSCNADLASESTRKDSRDEFAQYPGENQWLEGKHRSGHEDEKIEASEENNRSEDLPEGQTEKAEDELEPGPDDQPDEGEIISEDHQHRDQIPDWLISLTDEDIDSEQKGISQDPEIYEDELGLSNLEKEFSTWLAEMGMDDNSAPDQEQVGEPHEETEHEPELEQVELPEWLEALRPVEFVAPALHSRDEANELLEGRGPLAGIWGVLPSELEVAREGEPKSTSVVLQVSDNHRINADLLKGMLEEPGDTHRQASTKQLESQDYIRWITAFVLFAAIIWALISSGQEQNPRSLTAPAEVVSVYNLINKLAVGDRVLVAFEYDPGLSPELDAAAAPVVDHLFLRGVYLTMVSTSPTGPLLAERFITSSQGDHSIKANYHYVNLGYIPASTAGLISFSQNPRRTLPFTIKSDPAWGSADRKALTPLQGIYQVSDFSMVIVIADQPEVARAWIEQVVPYLRAGLEPTPLVMISSAQAEPLIRPYYEAIPKQIQGLVTGLAGGTSYSNLTRRESLPLNYWQAYGTGLMVAALLITLGGLIIISINLFPRHKGEGGEGSA